MTNSTDDQLEPDWREMALDLRRAGINDEDAARDMGVPVGTYQSWKYGNAKPNYKNGRRFVKYHGLHGNTKNQMP